MRDQDIDRISVVATLGAQDFGSEVVRTLSEQVTKQVSSGVMEGEIPFADTVFKFKKETKDVLLSMASEA